MEFDARSIRPVNMIVVRHGQTNANKEGWIMAQRHDLPLNEKGLADAETVADILAASDVMKAPGISIWSSPLRRAKQSADAFAKRVDVERVTCPHFIERDFGELSGKSWGELEKMQPGFKQIDTLLRYDYSPYSGEDADTVRRRTEKGLECAVRHCRHTGRNTVVLFTHFGIVQMIYNIATGKYLEPKNLQHFAFHLTFEEGWWPHADFLS